ncbi:MAG: recombinase family protein [Crocinitomicaceae bacterium]
MNNELDIFKQFAKEGNEPSLEGKTQAVIYTRVSTKEQAENNASLETQMKYCELYAKKRNLTVVEYFGGTYESAKSDERKEFQNMLNFVKRNNKIAYIIVYSFDRFSRTGANGSYITAQLKKRGIIVLSATQEVDATTSAGSFQQDLFFLFSKFDNELRRDKSVSGMQEKLRKGYINGVVPFGYTNMNPGKGKLPELVINKQGELLKKAFEMKAKHDLTYMEITENLKPLGWTKGHKKLSDYFRNPIYCGLIVSSLIPGEVIEGKHPALVSKEIFLKVNGLLQKKNYGGNYVRDDENLPLKQFVIAESCGTLYTGYLVKKKGLYYYKNNRIGSKENRSAKMMHELFIQFLKNFQLKNKEVLEPIKEIVQQEFIALQEESINAVLAIGEKSNEVEKHLETIERRFVIGEITKELYQKYKAEFEEELIKIRRQLENSRFKLSNLENALAKAMKFALKLPEMWQNGNLEVKRRIQKIVFPDGIRYDHQNHTYRTTRVNLLFAGIPLIQEDLLKKENGTSSNFKNLSRLVP